MIHSHSFGFSCFFIHPIGRDVFQCFLARKKKRSNSNHHTCYSWGSSSPNLFHCQIILAKQLSKSGENTAHQRSRILQTKDIYYLPFSSLKILWLLLEIRKPLQLRMAFSSCIWLTIGLSGPASQATQGVALPRQLWVLAVTFPQHAEERPQNSGRLRRSRCAYLPVNGPRWAPWGCSKQAKRCNDSLQTLETEFFMNYLIETKETFSAPTSATNKTVPLKWINK